MNPPPVEEHRFYLRRWLGKRWRRIKGGFRSLTSDMSMTVSSPPLLPPIPYFGKLWTMIKGQYSYLR